MNKTRIICFFLIIWTGSLYGNNDSLMAIWNDENLPGIDRLKSLHKAAGKLLFSMPDSAKKLAKMQIAFAKELNQPIHVAEGINLVGITYAITGDQHNAIKQWRQSLAYYIKSNDSVGLAQANNNIGLSHMYLGEHDSSLYRYKKSVEITLLTGDSIGLAKTYNNLGVVYYQMAIYVQAMDYFKKSTDLKEALNTTIDLANSYNNMGLIYFDQKEFRLAIEKYERSLAIALETNNLRSTAMCYINLANANKMLHNYSIAIYWCNLGIEARISLGDNAGLAEMYNAFSEIYVDMVKYGSDTLFDTETDSITIPSKEELRITAVIFLDSALIINKKVGRNDSYAGSLFSRGNMLFIEDRYEEAIPFFQESLELGEAYNFISLQVNCHGALLECYRNLGRYKACLTSYENYVRTKDTLSTRVNSKTIIRQQTEHEFEKRQLVKDQEQKDAQRLLAEVTSRRDNLQYSIILISLLLVFGGVLSLGFIQVSPKVAEGLIFFSFLILFEFVLVLADPLVDQYSGGAPGYQLLFNAFLAGLIFPLHAFFERLLKSRLIKTQRKS